MIVTSGAMDPEELDQMIFSVIDDCLGIRDYLPDHADSVALDDAIHLLKETWRSL